MTRNAPPFPMSFHSRIHVHDDLREFDVIGDVHGCYEELVELLERLGHRRLLDPDVARAADHERPQVIFVGDIVDRGDGIIEALQLVHRLWKRGHALTVLGNHDDRFHRWLAGGDVHIRHGLEASIEQFDRLPPDARHQWRTELLDFFSRLPWAMRIDRGRALVAHAAWHADLHLEASPERIRRYALFGPTTGQRTAEGYPERIDWAPHYTGPDLVIFGHQVYPEPYRNDYAVGIDTGCVFGGALTAYRYPSGEIVSVASRRARVAK